MNPTELQAFVEAERRKAVLVGGLVGVLGGFIIARQMNPHGGAKSDLMWGLGLGVLASTIANVFTKHTGVA